MKKSISIIMPLFNAEKYLEECLISVLNQSFREFELICINDASTDGTGEILENYQKKDERIRILQNEKRLGAALSRNRGIEEAKGKYICFLDGDDIFEEEMLSLAYKTAENNKTDIVIYSSIEVTDECIYEKKKIKHGASYIKKFCLTPFSIRDCNQSEYAFFSLSPCNKLYLKSFIIENKLQFQDLPSFNDVYFVDMAYLMASKIIVLNDERVMVYARMHSVPTRISADRNPMCCYWAMEKVQKELIKRNELENYYQFFYYQLFVIIWITILKLKKKDIAEKFYVFLKQDGIKTFKNRGGEFYEYAVPYVRNLLEQFENRDFEEAWYEEYNPLSFSLEDNYKEIKDRFEIFERDNKKIGVWGAGRNGRAFLTFCSKYDIKISAVMDVDKNKHGKNICGYSVCAPEDAYSKVDVIIVTGFGIYETIEEGMRKENLDICLIDINEWMRVI